MKYLLVIIALSLLNTNLTQANETSQQAANACQPRLYTQLDFFKISSGALKNNSSTAKSIICSIDNEFSEVFTENSNRPLGIRASVSYQTEGEGFSCTLYMRNKGNGALVDSVTSTLPGGNSLGSEIGEVFGGPYTDVYTYIQCALPSEARIFSIDITSAATQL